MKKKQFTATIEAYGDYTSEDIKKQLENALWVEGISGFNVTEVKEKTDSNAIHTAPQE
jgi:hypothetical protein